MPCFNVHVKWGKEKFPDVECNTDEPPIVFKAQLFALSGVQPDRQKLMVKGATVTDESWGKAKLKDGATLLMMGSAGELPSAPAEKPVFMEDLTDQQLATAMQMPPGLKNLGNTCYMNATLQCLRSVPELREALKRMAGAPVSFVPTAPDASITSAVKNLFDEMDRTGATVHPTMMLHVLHICFPRFAEKQSEFAQFMQQDANECWTEMVRCLQRKVPGLTAESDSPQEAATSSPAKEYFIDQYFRGQFSSTMKCIETDDESETKSTEDFYQLSCFIDKEVKYLHTGLRNRLEEHITKRSETFDRDAQYKKTSRLSRIPAYLTIQMVRFYYKEKGEINAKILKDIKFPMQLDVFDLCSEDLQQRLLPMRDRFKVEEDRRVEAAAQTKAKDNATKSQKKEEDDDKLQSQPFSFADDAGSNNSGYYELQAILTHKGRSSDSGHYVAWARHKGDEWMMFDDENVSMVHAEDVLKLSGGGDWHCAYVLLYAPKVLKIDPSLESKVDDKVPMETETTENGQSTSAK